jgi:predicted kinase
MDSGGSVANKPELIIFTGNIGSGKSFMASKYAKKGYVIVNNDAITKMVQGGEYGMYDHAKKPIYKAIEIGAIEAALVQGFSVVIDRTNMKASDREQYIIIGKMHNAHIRSITWGDGNSKSLNRRLKNPMGVPQATWKSVYEFMSKSYEVPTLDEGFDSAVSAVEKFTFYAFDFDGTIVENEFPDIGNIIDTTRAQMQKIWEDIQNVIIIWTCRSGDILNVMRKFLIDEKIPFDFINENPIVGFGSRKIFAHKYFDDRNMVL